MSVKCLQDRRFPTYQNDFVLFKHDSPLYPQLTSLILLPAGNHEYYTHDVKNWIAHLESLGITCLSNKNVKIGDQGTAQDWFYIAGTHDIESERLMTDKYIPCGLCCSEKMNQNCILKVSRIFLTTRPAIRLGDKKPF